MSVLAFRLKEARLKSGLSQEELGLRSGLEVESASARMNRYERGTRVPTIELMERISKVLDLPLPYFYSTSEDEASLLIAFHRMDASSKQALLREASRIEETSGSCP